MNYIQRIYDLLTEAVEVSESNRASKMKKYQLAKSSDAWKRSTGAKTGADLSRGTSGEDESGDMHWKGRAGEPGTGKGGSRQMMHQVDYYRDPDNKVGAHSHYGRRIKGGDDTGESRGVKKERLTSTPKNQAKKIIKADLDAKATEKATAKAQRKAAFKRKLRSQR